MKFSKPQILDHLVFWGQPWLNRPPSGLPWGPSLPQNGRLFWGLFWSLLALKGGPILAKRLPKFNRPTDAKQLG